MKRIFGRVVVLSAAAFAFGAVAPACVENDQSIFIRSVLAPSTNRQNGACTYTDDPQQPELFEGRLDVGVRDNYRAVVLVGNQMVGRGDPLTTRAEPNRVHLNGAVVRVVRPDGSQIAEFTSLASGFTDTQSSNNPDFGLMQVVAIDAPTAEKLRAELPQERSRATKQVVVQMKAFGKTLGGVDVESSEYQFIIEVCNGCLVSFAGDPAAGATGACPPAAAQTNGAQLPCEPGQDESTPCQLCLDKKVCTEP